MGHNNKQQAHKFHFAALIQLLLNADNEFLGEWQCIFGIAFGKARLLGFSKVLHAAVNNTNEASPNFDPVGICDTKIHCVPAHKDNSVSKPSMTNCKAIILVMMRKNMAPT